MQFAVTGKLEHPNQAQAKHHILLLEVIFNLKDILDAIYDDNARNELLLPLRMTLIVVKGFSHGSKELGIPMVNLDRDKVKCCFGHAGCGCDTTNKEGLSSTSTHTASFYPPVYIGDFCHSGTEDLAIYKIACSIGQGNFFMICLLLLECHHLTCKVQVVLQ
jgi:hypothetical protein